MSFLSIVGHAKAIAILHKQLETKRIPGGYLFAGPRGVGKLTTALSFACTLNCSSGGDDECDICRRIHERNYPDVEVIDYEWQSQAVKKDKEKKRKTIGIEAIQQLQYRVSLKPMEYGWKIFIIDRAETMTPEAANSFLKILEEPPKQTVFILVTENESRLLATIRSRCQIIRFGFLSKNDFSTVLSTHGMQKRDQYWFADGSPGQAIEAGVEGKNDLDHLMPLWDMISQGNMLDVLQEVQKEYNTNDEIASLLNNLLIIAKQHFRKERAHDDCAVSMLFKAQQRLRINANAKLLRDVTLIKLTRGAVCRSL
ncbi:MAG: DNA polymerase III subunit delta' [bacterium]